MFVFFFCLLSFSFVLSPRCARSLLSDVLITSFLACTCAQAFSCRANERRSLRACSRSGRRSRLCGFLVRALYWRSFALLAGPVGANLAYAPRNRQQNRRRGRLRNCGIAAADTALTPGYGRYVYVLRVCAFGDLAERADFLMLCVAAMRARALIS